MGRRNRAAIKRERALERRIRNAELLVLLYFVGATAVLTFAFGGVFLAANTLYSRPEDGAEVVLRPGPSSLYMAGGLIAFLVAFLTCERVHKRLLGRPPESFSADYTIVALPCPSWLNRTAVICLVGASLVAILNIRKHAAIGSAFIVDQLALSILPDRYPLNGVRNIEMSRFYIAATKYSSSRISEEPALFVRFKDGRVWSPHHAELDVRDQASLAEVISARSGKPILYTSDIEGIPDQAGVRRRTRIVVNVIGGSIVFSVALWAIRRHIRARRRLEPATHRKVRRNVGS